MDMENKNVVSDIMKRLKQVEHLNKRNRELTEAKVELHDKLKVMISFLNRDVVGASTSSLIRTDIQIGVETTDWNQKIIKELLTINNKGFGTIKDGGYYGASMSNSMQSSEFIEHMLDSDIQNKLLVFLAKNNNKKMLTVCTQLFSNLDLIKQMKDISLKYDKEISIKALDTPLNVAIPKMEYIGNDTSVPVVTDMVMRSVVSIGSGSIYLLPVSPEHSEDMINDMKSYRYRSSRDEPSSYVEIKLGSIEGSMIMVQIKDELDKAFDDLNVDINKDMEQSKVIEEQINTEFSTFKLAKEFN